MNDRSDDWVNPSRRALRRAQRIAARRATAFDRERRRIERLEKKRQVDDARQRLKEERKRLRAAASAARQEERDLRRKLRSESENTAQIAAALARAVAERQTIEDTLAGKGNNEQLSTLEAIQQDIQRAEEAYSTARREREERRRTEKLERKRERLNRKAIELLAEKQLESLGDEVTNTVADSTAQPNEPGHQEPAVIDALKPQLSDVDTVNATAENDVKDVALEPDHPVDLTAHSIGQLHHDQSESTGSQDSSADGAPIQIEASLEDGAVTSHDVTESETLSTESAHEESIVGREAEIDPTSNLPVDELTITSPRAETGPDFEVEITLAEVPTPDLPIGDGVHAATSLVADTERQSNLTGDDAGSTADSTSETLELSDHFDSASLQVEVSTDEPDHLDARAVRRAARSEGRAIKTEERRRLRAEKKAERDRRRQEKQAERDQIRAERTAERDRRSAEKQAERDQIRAEKQAERDRRSAEKQAERDRRRAEKNQQNEQSESADSDKQAERDRRRAEKIAERIRRRTEKLAERDRLRAAKDEQNEQSESADSDEQAERDRRRAEKELARRVAAEAKAERKAEKRRAKEAQTSADEFSTGMPADPEQTELDEHAPDKRSLRESRRREAAEERAVRRAARSELKEERRRAKEERAAARREERENRKTSADLADQNTNGTLLKSEDGNSTFGDDDVLTDVNSVNTSEGPIDGSAEQVLEASTLDLVGGDSAGGEGAQPSRRAVARAERRAALSELRERRRTEKAEAKAARAEKRQELSQQTDSAKDAKREEKAERLRIRREERAAQRADAAAARGDDRQNRAARRQEARAAKLEEKSLRKEERKLRKELAAQARSTRNLLSRPDSENTDTATRQVVIDAPTAEELVAGKDATSLIGETDSAAEIGSAAGTDTSKTQRPGVQDDTSGLQLHDEATGTESAGSEVPAASVTDDEFGARAVAPVTDFGSDVAVTVAETDLSEVSEDFSPVDEERDDRAATTKGGSRRWLRWIVAKKDNVASEAVDDKEQRRADRLNEKEEERRAAQDEKDRRFEERQQAKVDAVRTKEERRRSTLERKNRDRQERAEAKRRAREIGQQGKAQRAEVDRQHKLDREQVRRDRHADAHTERPIGEDTPSTELAGERLGALAAMRERRSARRRLRSELIEARRDRGTDAGGDDALTREEKKMLREQLAEERRRIEDARRAQVQADKDARRSRRDQEKSDRAASKAAQRQEQGEREDLVRSFRNTRSEEKARKKDAAAALKQEERQVRDLRRRETKQRREDEKAARNAVKAEGKYRAEIRKQQKHKANQQRRLLREETKIAKRARRIEMPEIAVSRSDDGSLAPAYQWDAEVGLYNSVGAGEAVNAAEFDLPEPLPRR
jgi:hypothetical protein